jgi:hypothetical protein
MSPHGVVTTSGGLGGGKRSSFGAVCSTIVSAIADGRILPFLIRWAMIRGDCASCKFRGKKVVKVRSQRLANKKLSNSPSRCTNRVQLLESFFIGNCCSQNFLRHLVIATAPSSKLSHRKQTAQSLCDGSRNAQMRKRSGYFILLDATFHSVLSNALVVKLDDMLSRHKLPTNLEKQQAPRCNCAKRQRQNKLY